MNNPLFAPVVALVGWSLIMLVWMTLARLDAMKSVDPALTRKPGTRGADLEAILPAKAQWSSHNYNHLMEQPTLFYAICIVLALSGGGTDLDVYLAWAYVALRVIHSIVQATVNIVPIRFPVFALATFVLIALTIRAAVFAI